MAKPRIIEDVIEPILQNRIDIARYSGVISRKEITEQWDISYSTLYRYLSPERREESVQYARRHYQLTPKRDLSKCHVCNESVRTHTVCKDCACLTHNTDICDFCLRFREKRVVYSRLEHLYG